MPRLDLPLRLFMGPTFVIVPQQTTDYMDCNALQVFGWLVGVRCLLNYIGGRIML